MAMIRKPGIRLLQKFMPAICESPSDRTITTTWCSVRLLCVLAGLIPLADGGQAAETEDFMRAGTHTPAGHLDVEFDNGILNLTVREVTINELLQEVARQSGLLLLLHDPLDERITMEIQRLSLHEAMGHILRGYSFVLQYDQRLPGSVKSGATQVSALQVFSDEEGYEHTSLAIESRSRVGIEEAIASFNLGLPEEDKAVRLDTVVALTRVGNSETAQALAIAVDDSDVSVREEAVDALGGIGDKSVIPLLARALHDPENSVREAAIAAFANIGGDESAQALMVVLNDEDDSLREQAVDALSDIGGETAIRLLKQALTDQERDIQEAAAESLADLLERGH